MLKYQLSAPLVALLVSAAACAGASRAAQPAAADLPIAPSSRQQIVPLVEYHQHIMGPAAIAMVALPPSLPAITLPPELARLVAERERISGDTALHDVYTNDAQILDVSEGEDHWMRGAPAIAHMIAAYAPDTHFIPNAFGVDANGGWIAGVVRTGESTTDEMSFTWGVRRDAGGRWRIALEQATNMPPRAFAEPLTADRTIQVLDDAGIRRGVVLSAAYWIGDGTFHGTIDEEYAKVRQENDWVVAQVSRFPDRLVAFCGVNPLRAYAVREVERCATLPHVRGIKLHFGNSRVDVKDPEHVAAVRRVFAAANARKLALVVHLWTMDKSYGRPNAEIFLREILSAAPDVTVQVAHLGGAGRYAYDDVTQAFVDAFAAHDPRVAHLYFDLATVVTEGQSAETLALIARRLRQIGMERILFGADTPILDRPPPALAWATIRRRLPITDDELRVVASNVAPYMR